MGDQEGRQGATVTGEGTVGGRRSRILSPPGDAAQGDQRKTAVNCNNYSSGRALDDENILGGRGLVSMIKDEDDQAGVATGGDDEGNIVNAYYHNIYYFRSKLLTLV